MYGPPEHVMVENALYDGPRAGVALVGGQPHRFVSQWDDGDDDEEYVCRGTFLVWPVDAGEVALELEQWRIFVDWNERYEAGVVDADSHPGIPGTNSRWDEIERQLATRRASVPSTARRARARISWLEQPQRYAASGPDYQLGWKLL
jgi:hypothetical protein